VLCLSQIVFCILGYEVSIHTLDFILYLV
jgi:hypothetical protein